RNMEIQGGPGRPILFVVAQTLSVLASGPGEGTYIPYVAAVAACAMVAAVVHAVACRDDRWLLYISGGIFVPALFVLGRPSVHVYSRYFIVPSALFVIAVGSWLAALLRQSGWRRWLATATIVAVTVGCVRSVADLYVDGRGRFDDAVRRMTSTNPAITTVATIPEFSLFDKRVKMLLDYYLRSTQRD